MSPSEPFSQQLVFGSKQRALARRSYKLKSVEEKKDPKYKVKREKNNDTVRKFRERQRKILQEKEDRLAFLEQEVMSNSKRYLFYLKKSRALIGRIRT